MEPQMRADQYARLNDFRSALGLLADTPLGAAAMQQFDGPLPQWPRRPFAEQPVHRPRRKPKLRLFNDEFPQGAA
jgi:hypothetical protein